MAQPWHDEPEDNSYMGAYIISEDFAGTLDDFSQGHWYTENGEIVLFSRPSYAIKRAVKNTKLGPNYLLLVKIELENGRTGWQIMITHKDVNEMFSE